MTHEELRELDRELAKGMGWKYQQQDPEVFSCPSGPKDNGWWLQPGMTQWRCDGCQGVPEYSTDIAQAFEVVDCLIGKGWDFSLSIRQGSLWYALFEQYPALALHIGTWHEERSLAICLAAREVMRI